MDSEDELEEEMGEDIKSENEEEEDQEDAEDQDGFIVPDDDWESVQNNDDAAD